MRAPNNVSYRMLLDVLNRRVDFGDSSLSSDVFLLINTLRAMQYGIEDQVSILNQRAQCKSKNQAEDAREEKPL